MPTTVWNRTDAAAAIHEKAAQCCGWLADLQPGEQVPARHDIQCSGLIGKNLIGQRRETCPHFGNDFQTPLFVPFRPNQREALHGVPRCRGIAVRDHFVVLSLDCEGATPKFAWPVKRDDFKRLKNVEHGSKGRPISGLANQ